jgi:hypothetical protein
VNPKRVIVIGAGIGGLAAAIGLRRVGLEPVVFERAAELREVGAGLSLWPNALRALEDLGLAEQIRSLSIPEAAGGLRSWDGRMLMAMSGAELLRELGDVTVMIHRASTPERASSGRPSRREMHGFAQDRNGVTALRGWGRRPDKRSSAPTACTQPSGATLWQEPAAIRAILLACGYRFDHLRLTAGISTTKSQFGQVPMSGARFMVRDPELPERSRSARGLQEPAPGILRRLAPADFSAYRGYT